MFYNNYFDSVLHAYNTVKYGNKNRILEQKKKKRRTFG